MQLHSAPLGSKPDRTDMPLCSFLKGELQAMFEAGNIEMQLAEELEALELAKEQEEEKEAEGKKAGEDEKEQSGVEKETVEEEEEEEEAALESKAKHDLHLLDTKISLASHNTTSALEEITQLLQSSSITTVDGEASETIVIVKETLLVGETVQEDDAKDKLDASKASDKGKLPS